MSVHKRQVTNRTNKLFEFKKDGAGEGVTSGVTGTNPTFGYTGEPSLAFSYGEMTCRRLMLDTSAFIS
jgi:hypothetical protein